MRVPASAARLVAAAFLALSPCVAQAQTAVTADVMMASGFVWRAIHFTNRPVVQADLIATHTRGTLAITAGAWVNAEPADYQGADVVKMLEPTHHGPAITTIAPWLDATITRGALSLTGGATIYRYPKFTGFAEAFNSTEVYAKAALAGALAPRVQVWWDVEKVRGAYIEAAVSHTFESRLPITTSLTSGWSAGQEVRGTQTAYFTSSGLAAVDGAVGVPFTRGHFTVTPTVHGVYGRDAATRLVTPGAPERAVKLWWTFGGTWTR